MAPPLPHGPPGAEKPVLARPNVVMFGDWDFVGIHSTSTQVLRYQKFLKTLKEVDFAVIEIGAGTGIPTIRLISQSLLRDFKGATLIRINPLEPEVPDDMLHRSICLKMKGLEALEAIDKLMKKC